MSEWSMGIEWDPAPPKVMGDETFIEHYVNYSHDCAKCSCQPTHAYEGIPCVAVSRFAVNDEYGLLAIDRCKGCGFHWPAINYRWEQS